mgnify:CR=1 FL=1
MRILQTLDTSGTVRDALGFASSTNTLPFARIGYPVMVRPSYVLGGRGMEVVFQFGCQIEGRLSAKLCNHAQWLFLVINAQHVLQRQRLKIQLVGGRACMSAVRRTAPTIIPPTTRRIRTR